MFKCRTYGRHLAYKNVNMVCVRFKNSKSSASIDLSCQEIQPALKTAFISFLHSITRNYSVPERNVCRATPYHVSIYCWTLISPKEHRPSRFWTAGIHPPPTTFFQSSVHHTAGCYTLRLPSRSLYPSKFWLQQP